MNLKPLELALRKRLAVVADHAHRDRDPASHLEALRSAHQELLLEISKLPPGTDPRLMHFLEGQSYPKAVAFLEQSAAPGG